MRCEGHPLILDAEAARSIAEAVRDGVIGPRRRDVARVNQSGGKGIIKFNPTADETQAGIKQQVTLVDWSSPDGEPRAVTVDVGRIAGGGGGTFPTGGSGTVALPNLSYRARAQVLIGTPATQADPFFLDINRGQRFTCTASYVAATAEMLAPAATLLVAFRSSDSLDLVRRRRSRQR